MTIATLTLEYVPPHDTPQGLVEWATELDLPGIRATVELAENQPLLPDAMNMAWGANYTAVRKRVVIFRSATLGASEIAACGWFESGVAIYKAQLARYRARLVERARAIEAAHAAVGRVAIGGTVTVRPAAEPE